MLSARLTITLQYSEKSLSKSRSLCGIHTPAVGSLHLRSVDPCGGVDLAEQIGVWALRHRSDHRRRGLLARVCQELRGAVEDLFHLGVEICDGLDLSVISRALKRDSVLSPPLASVSLESNNVVRVLNMDAQSLGVAST